MAVNVKSKCWILALFIRDDGERLVLGDGAYDFKDKQQHFTANAMVNDTIDVQGNDGTLIAGQVRRASTQSFDGYIGDATASKPEVETYRRAFISFFAKNHFYKVIYVLPDGSAVKRQRGFIVDAPEVKELWQIHPEYHVALNFEDVNYYNYNENEDGEEIYSQIVQLAKSGADSGGLVWDEVGAVNLGMDMQTATASGTTIEIIDAAIFPPTDFRMDGDTVQDGTPTPTAPVAVQTVSGENTITITGEGGTKSLPVNLSGKNLFNGSILGNWGNNRAAASVIETGVRVTNLVSGNYLYSVIPLSNSADLLGETLTISTIAQPSVSGSSIAKIAIWTVDTANSRLITMIGEKPATGQGAGQINITINTPDTYTGTADSLAILLYSGVSTSVAQNEYTDYTNIQIEKGSTATTYEPYYNIELCKIGTAQDYIYRQNGSWWLHKETAKLILDGSSDEYWYISGNALKINNLVQNGSATSLGYPEMSSQYSFSDGTTAGLYSNFGIEETAKYINQNPSSGMIGLAVYGTGGGDSSLYVSASSYTVANWRTLLSSTPLSCYYVVATPTNIEITAPTLVSQLDTILATSLYSGQNTITTQTANLVPSLSVTYMVDSDEPGGFEWEEGGNASITIIQNNSIDYVYPVITINGPASNPAVENVTTGQTISYNGTISAEQTLIIDTTAQTAKLNGLNVISNLEGSWLHLTPGDNRLTYVSDDADTPPATLEWSEVVG